MEDQIPVSRSYGTALQDLAAKRDDENINIWSLCVCASRFQCAVSFQN